VNDGGGDGAGCFDIKADIEGSFVFWQVWQR